MKRILLIVLLVNVLPLVPLFGQATTDDKQQIRKKIETSDFSRVENEIDNLLEIHAPSQILLVVDIDNTLLAMNQDLGSDQWFNWQNSLLKDDPSSTHLVAQDFPGLLRVQGQLFALSGMHPPEPSIPATVDNIIDKRIPTVVLTSRGPDFRDAAQRELKRNGYRRLLQSNNELQIRERRGLFKPFNPEQPNLHGLSSKEVAQMADSLRDVSFSNGIYMTAGQHKGFMLKTLLARSYDAAQPNSVRQFKAIVFVDDHDKHTEAMHEAFPINNGNSESTSGQNLDLITVHYMQEDGNVENFNQSSKQHVVRDWNKLRDFLDTVLVK